MNHNSFPSGEQVPTQQDDGDVAKLPSFEEHMQNMEQQNGGEKQNVVERAKNAIHRILHRKEWAKYNAQELMRPSLRNMEQPYANPTVDRLRRKLRDGEDPSIGDIVSLSNNLGFNFEGDAATGFLDEIGFSSGHDFDIRTPAHLFTPDGKIEQTSLDISFKNNQGDFTRISIEKSKDDNKTYIYSWKGRREFTDVGYDGPAPTRTIDGNKTRDQKAITIE